MKIVFLVLLTVFVSGVVSAQQKPTWGYAPVNGLVLAITYQVNVQRGPRPVSYCSLFDPTNQGKTVSSKALMSYSTVSRVDGSDTFLYSSDCNGVDYFAIPDGSSKVWSKWQNFFDSLQPGKNLILEIQFEGKPDVETSQLFGSLDGWTRARIEFSRILSVKDVTLSPNAVLPNHNAAKPHIERIERMRVDLQNFLQSLYALISSKSVVENSLPNDFSFIDLHGKRFNKDQYLTMNTVWVESSFGVSESQISYQLKEKTDSTITWRGKLHLVRTNGAGKTYSCDVTFVLKNGEWNLRQAVMVRGS